MKCKKHPTDFTSSVGVCASCLRERLFALIAAQVQDQAQEDRRKSDMNPPPPLAFPRSVSPYISWRKSENVTTAWHHHHSLISQNFFSTPQVGLIGEAAADATTKKNYYGKFSLLSKLFRSTSFKPGSVAGADPGPRVSDSIESCAASSSSPSSWFSTIIPSRRKKQSRTFFVDESVSKEHRKACRNLDRGMSPAMYSDEEDEHGRAGSSGYSSESSSQGWKHTPRRTPSSAMRRNNNRNVSGIAFCLSPLVRASPSRHWNQKGGVPPEVAVTGEIRLPVKPQFSAATSFCKNRSRKLADFGRFSRKHG